MKLVKVFPLQLLTTDDVFKHLVLPNVTRMKVKCGTFWKLLYGVLEVKDARVFKAGILNLLQREFFLLLFPFLEEDGTIGGISREMGTNRCSSDYCYCSC